MGNKINNKKNFYIILILVSLLLAGIIYFFPTKKNKSVQNKNITKKILNKKDNKAMNIKEEKQVDLKNKATKKDAINKKELIKTRIIVRDIFNSKYLYTKEKVNNQKEKIKEELNFKVMGIAISDRGNKSIILNNGMILKEGDKVGNFKIVRINKAEVIVKNSLGKIIKLNVWEGE
ncbi:hypothetical protein [Haliovirga abyssi]|uniref:Type II secretion system protein GspC N-terminal domain-containing protein n=1 Tax=Haliovirga abyssi TaxID=2996794 RepID=A0AAU9E4J4_9FUSO|nr:hypothetical protein [Haliovirga abyssi]BDU51435.1 hypothetical protein HLVA_20040 [Haliovirga abyssi]